MKAKTRIRRAPSVIDDHLRSERPRHDRCGDRREHGIGCANDEGDHDQIGGDQAALPHDRAEQRIADHAGGTADGDHTDELGPGVVEQSLIERGDDIRNHGEDDRRDTERSRQVDVPQQASDKGDDRAPFGAHEERCDHGDEGESSGATPKIRTSTNTVSWMTSATTKTMPSRTGVFTSPPLRRSWW